jgi:dolichyl-phosphate-mannose--protein O-mannosyl transferase
LLLAVLWVQLALTARRHSMTVDEGNHIYSGYMSWKTFDFGLNPEHPPLVKLLAAAPLLTAPLKLPTPLNVYFKADAYLGGRSFLLDNDKDMILFRARMAASLLAVLLAFLVFLTAREMFVTGAGLLVLAVVAFDPNLLAHGALVTTDVGGSCFFLASVYAFYRWRKSPSPGRLVLVGLAAGLVLAAKHSGMFVVLMLGALALTESLTWLWEKRPRPREIAAQSARSSAALIVVCAVAIVTLWAFYGFRYSARPRGQVLRPPIKAMIG